MRAILTCLIAAMLGAGDAVAPPVAVALPPPPPDGEVAQQQQTVRDLYKADYASRDPAKRAELAKRLIQLSATGQPAERVALLREAIAIAAKVGDLEAARAAISSLCASWRLDPLDERIRLYEIVVVGSADLAQDAASDLLPSAEAAILADQYVKAQRLAELASGFARKAKDDSLVQRCRSCLDRAKDLGAEYARIQTANPDLLDEQSPESAAALGRFYGLSKGDWRKALPLLAASNDAMLKATAIADLAAEDGDAHAKVGEDWTELAKKAPAKQRPALYRRALDHLEQAAGAATGLAKAKLDKRIAELEPLAGKRQSAALLPGALLWLDGEPPADGKGVSDAGPLRLPVTVTGKPQFLREAHGGYLHFDGTCTLSTTLRAPIPANGAFTMVLWLRVSESMNGGYDVLANLGACGFIGRARTVFLTHLLSGTPPTSASKYAQGCRGKTDTWFHVAFAADLAKCDTIMYVDGVAFPVAAAVSGPLPAAISTIGIGVPAKEWGTPFIADLDDYGLFNRQLTPPEVKTVYEAGRRGRR